MWESRGFIFGTGSSKPPPQMYVPKKKEKRHLDFGKKEEMKWGRCKLARKK